MNMSQRSVLFFLILGIVIVASPMVEAAKTYTMKKGDTLWDLAAKNYGDPTLYPVFLEVNNIDNPRTIPTGKQIIIPGFDEIKKVANEIDPRRRKELIDQMGKNMPAEPKDNEPSGNTATKDDEEKYEPVTVKSGDTTMRSILNGPSVSGKLLKKVVIEGENRPR